MRRAVQFNDDGAIRAVVDLEMSDGSEPPLPIDTKQIELVGVEKNLKRETIIKNYNVVANKLELK